MTEITKPEKAKTKEIAIKGNYQIDQPAQMVSMAKVLKYHIVSQNLFTNIQGKNYAHVEGWQFAGGLLGMFPLVSAVENLSATNEIKWKADVEIVNLKTGNIVSRGFAICSNKESKKAKFDEYAVLSMAQTRAIGKAYRNVVGWVMKLAGYESTPSEEMAKMGEKTSAATPTQDRETKEKVVQIEEYVCHGATKGGCGNDLTKQENDYSMKMYGKPLCRDCQKLSTPKKK